MTFSLSKLFSWRTALSKGADVGIIPPEDAAAENQAERAPSTGGGASAAQAGDAPAPRSDLPELSATSKHLCRSCDLVFEMPPYRKGVKVICPQCRTQQRSGYKASLYDLAVISIASLIMLLTSVTLPFMSIAAMGISQSMSLISIFYVLKNDWALLLYICLFFTFLFPLGMHTIVIAHVFLHLKITPPVAKIYSFCFRFAMVDVFILGVLISLVKLVGLAEVTFHIGFFTAMVFAVLMMWCYHHGSPYRIWERVLKHTEGLQGARCGGRGIDQGLIMCRHCGMVYRRLGGVTKPHGTGLQRLYAGEEPCPRCGGYNDYRATHCGQKTVALLLAAIIMYVPSNVYPIMFTSYLGSDLGSNILDGVVSLWGMGSYFVALVILVASICIPVIKIVCLVWLLCLAFLRPSPHPSKSNKLYHLVLFIGRWSMIDVFVVIIMSTVVRITGIITIDPGIAILFFCSVVLITMLAADEFDERLIWDNLKAHAPTKGTSRGSTPHEDTPHGSTPHEDTPHGSTPHDGSPSGGGARAPEPAAAAAPSAATKASALSGAACALNAEPKRPLPECVLPECAQRAQVLRTYQRLRAPSGRPVGAAGAPAKAPHAGPSGLAPTLSLRAQLRSQRGFASGI